DTDPSLHTRVFKRIYVCLGALREGFGACRREVAGLYGAFMKGTFQGQVLAAVGLDPNNEIYPLAYTLVEAEMIEVSFQPPKHHVQIGSSRKKRKRSKFEDGPLVRDGKLSKKERTISCESCENIRHNKSTCKGQGQALRTEASGNGTGQVSQVDVGVGHGQGGSSIGPAQCGNVVVQAGPS
ncbi:hypothetical protein Tco_0181018, partial [Tanacetum coccineum]